MFFLRFYQYTINVLKIFPSPQKIVLTSGFKYQCVIIDKIGQKIKMFESSQTLVTLIQSFGNQNESYFAVFYVMIRLNSRIK